MTENINSDDAKYQRVKKRVEEEKGFYSHLTTYLLVNLLLFLICMYSGSGSHWYIWSLLGWGVGIVSHWFSVFGQNWFLGKGWEERRIKDLMDED